MVLSPAQLFSQLRDNICIVFASVPLPTPPAEPFLRLNTQLSSMCLSRRGAFAMFTSVYACRKNFRGVVSYRLNQDRY